MGTITQNIGELKEIIQSSLSWADSYKKESFPRKKFKEYRRQAKILEYSLGNRCSIAAYGESQVGKSYLMGSLLSSSDTPFVLEFDGREYNFVDEINPSGCNNTEIESTGVITRFTTKSKIFDSHKYVKIQNLSIADILMLVVDSYYNDVKINARKTITPDSINQELVALADLWRDKSHGQFFLDEDHIRDIQEYMIEVVGVGASNIINSNFFDTIAENIQYIPIDKWTNVFELLWNKNENFCKLFKKLLEEYAKIGFQTEVCVPFEAILREQGTLMQIQWLDLVCGKQITGEIDLPVLTINVYDTNGNLLAENYSKTFLSAFAAEIELVLPEIMQVNRPFLTEVDLLDFPGARNRLDKIEDDIDYTSDMPEILRRGKVAYLFNKYVRTRRISSIMFCHHDGMKKANLGNTIKDWVEKSVGLTPAQRQKNLESLDNVSPLFVIATKFNKDLSKRGNELPGKLANHWERFTRVLPEIVGSAQWFENWQEKNGDFIPFRSIYPLRDFYWSSCGPNRSALFDGYNNMLKTPEVKLHEQEGYPEFFTDLYRSFIEQPFVQKHFANPDQTWKDVMTVAQDGSEAIIRDISKISSRLHTHREKTSTDELLQMHKEILDVLNGFYEPEDDEAKSSKMKMITTRVKAGLNMSFAKKPETFGRIIDSLMVGPEVFRKVARNIIVLRTEIPRDFSAVNYTRAIIGINPGDGREANLQKMLDYNGVSSVEELNEIYAAEEYTVEDVIANGHEFCATEADVITKHVLNRWIEHLNESVKSISQYVPFPEEVILTFQTLLMKLGVKQRISENIAKYEKLFNDNERLNAIADYVSLELNNFIGTVGRKFMNEEHIAEIEKKAMCCKIKVDISPGGIEPARERQTVTDALMALDNIANIMRQPAFSEADIEMLRRLPHWDNFQRWQNLLMIGMILSNGLSTKDPAENNAVRELIDRINTLHL